MKKNKKKTIVICLSVFVAFCIVGSIIGFIILNHKSNDNSEIDCKIAYEQYANVRETLYSVESNCANDDGYIESNEVNSTINTMITKLNGLKDDGVITKYEKEDTGIYIELASGVGYLYTLNIKDMMPGDKLGRIVTVEPYAYNKEFVSHYLLGGRSPDKSAEIIASSFSNEYKFDKSDIEFNIDSFEADDVSKLMNNKIIIWYGHGGYTSETGSCLGTSAPITDQYTLLKYNQELANKEIILGSENFVITPAFLEKHLENNSLNGSIVYLGACETGRDNRLSDVFINKGAKTVIGNTRSIFTRYNLYMLTDFFEGLTNTSDNGEAFTAEQALAYAKKKNGEKDGEFFFLGAEVVIFGDKNIRLSNQNNNPTTKPTEKPTESNPTEYTAVELASKSLNEIIEIMGGDYKSEHVQLSNAFSSSGAPYIYNYDVLPGFAFETYENDYHGISIMDGAKLNSKISSDMSYNQIADIIGDMEGYLVAQEGNIACSNTIDGYDVTFCFIENDYIRSHKDNGGKLTVDVLRGGNPSLQSIGLRREAVIQETEAPTERQKKSSSNSEYSSYLGTWESIFDNNGELDENYAIVTSVTFNEINGTTADLTIFRGNIAKVCQIDVTGEIIDGKIEFSYDKDGWENSGHGTVTLNENSVHLFAEVDSYGPNARTGLNCDETLTRQ